MCTSHPQTVGVTDSKRKKTAANIQIKTFIKSYQVYFCWLKAFTNEAAAMDWQHHITSLALHTCSSNSSPKKKKHNKFTTNATPKNNPKQ